MQIDFCSGIKLVVESAERDKLKEQVQWNALMFGGRLATDVEEATDEVGHTVADAVMDRFKAWR